MTPFSLLPVAHAATTCGPTLPPDAEIARALLLVFPLFLLAVPLFRRLTRLARGPWGDVEHRGDKVWRCAFWASVVSALANLPGASALTFGIAVLAVWFVGASWVALCLLGWRALVHRHPDLAGWVPPLVVTALFTVLCWVARASSFAEPSFVLMVLAGLAGLAPIALLGAFVVEALLRGRSRVRAFSSPT